jgi:phage baseplate assembly protein W
MRPLTRAETLIGEVKKPEFFSDFLNSFAVTPIGNQLGRVVNEKTVNQSLKNLILTNVGERLFQPTIGSNITAMLFEPNIEESLSLLEFYIQNTIVNNEPRVNLIDLSVTPSSSDHEIVVSIVYNLINSPEPITFNFILKRVR